MILPSCHHPTLHPVLGYSVQSVISRIIINDVPYCILTNYYTCTICHYSTFMMTHKLHTPYHMHTILYILHTYTCIYTTLYILHTDTYISLYILHTDTCIPHSTQSTGVAFPCYLVMDSIIIIIIVCWKILVWKNWQIECNLLMFYHQPITSLMISCSCTSSLLANTLPSNWFGLANLPIFPTYSIL